MLDASISTDADVMEGERLCTLMGRCGPGRSSKPSNARQPMPEAKKWPTPRIRVQERTRDRPRYYERSSALRRSSPGMRMAAQNDIQEIEQGGGWVSPIRVECSS